MKCYKFPSNSFGEYNVAVPNIMGGYIFELNENDVLLLKWYETLEHIDEYTGEDNE